MVVMEAAVVTELEISTASVASVASVTASEPKSWVMHVLEVPVLEIESMTANLSPCSCHE